jgi:hypothetical protein
MWGVVIEGHIGHNKLRVLETYTHLKLAKRRFRDINRRGIAYVESIDEVLFPLTFTTPIFDSTIHDIPSLPKQDELGWSPYTRVEDLFEMYRYKYRSRHKRAA